MRKYLSVAVTLVALASVSAVALAAGSTFNLAVKVSSTKAGTVKKPKAVTLNVTTRTIAAAGQNADITQKVDLIFPGQFQFNGAKFPSCTKAILDRDKSTTNCPKGSKVGKGSADGVAATALGNVNVNLKVEALNAPRGKQILLFVSAQTPLRVNGTLVGTLSKVGKNTKITFVVPANLQQPVPGIKAALTRFQTSVGGIYKKSGKRYSFVATTGCPSNKKWAFSGKAYFDTGATSSASTTVACS
jgi:hypothetical protein